MTVNSIRLTKELTLMRVDTRVSDRLATRGPCTAPFVFSHSTVSPINPRCQRPLVASLSGTRVSTLANVSPLVLPKSLRSFGKNDTPFPSGEFMHKFAQKDSAKQQ